MRPGKPLQRHILREVPINYHNISYAIFPHGRSHDSKPGTTGMRRCARPRHGIEIPLLPAFTMVRER